MTVGFAELTFLLYCRNEKGTEEEAVVVRKEEEERDTTDGWLLGMDVQMDWVTGAWRLFWGRERVGMCSCFV